MRWTNSFRSRACSRTSASGLKPRPSTRGAQPEDLADDGGILKQRLLGRQKLAEPSGDDPVNRVRQLVDRADLGERPRELLGMQRIAGCS